MKAFRVYTGPCSVKEVAAKLLAAGAQKVYEGTESVYFALPASFSETRECAGGFVSLAYPHADFDVEAPLHTEWLFG